MKALFRILLMTIFTLANVSMLNAQWILQNSGVNASLSDVVMLDTVTAIAVGRNGSILRTTNSGTTWIDVTAPLSFIQPWSGVSFFDTSNGIVVGDRGVVLTTSNGGKGWIWHQIPGRQKCLSALQVGPNSVYVGADSGWVYNTSDTGRTWIAEKISTWPIRSLFAYRGPTIVGVSKYALTPYSLCTQYVIPPPSWNEKILPNFQGLGSAAFDAEFCNGGGAGFIVGVEGDLRSAPAILRKSMSDTAWREVSTGILRDGTLFSVSAPSANVIYVCGSNGMIYKSSNGGDTWLDQTVQTVQNVNAIFFYNEKYGFAVGDSGLILYTSNGGLTGVEDQEGVPPTKFVLEQNYPNPFNPATTISFSLPSKSFVSLKIFDALGREVSIMLAEELSAGNYVRQWNAVGLPSGVYFYRLQAGSYSKTRKLVLLR
ncbi:MAG: YCF48-related protein [Bacteroidota bacterium]